MSGPCPQYAIRLTPEQEGRLQPLSTCYMAPFASVQRAQIVLYAFRHPEWSNTTLAQRLGCSGTTVKRWCRRWQATDSLPDAPRAGTRRTFTALQRTRIVAWAWSAPRQYGKPWQRWSGEKWAQGAIEPQSGESIVPRTSRPWLRHDQSKPWRYHSWQPSTDPQFVEKAVPVLDLYAQAPALQAHGELTLLSVLMRKRRFKLANKSPPPRRQHPGKSYRSPIAINGWGPCNSFAPWPWLAD
jgi:Helix-turn-helix domain